MKHIGAICEPSPSHVMNMAAIGRELQNRGHRVTLFQFPEVVDPAAAGGLPFWPIAVPKSGFKDAYNSMLLRQQGVADRSFLKYAVQRARFVCEHAPAALAAAQVDCVLVDMIDPGAATVAEKLQLPFVTICNALPLNAEPLVPPDFLPWRYRTEWWARWRNSFAYRLRDLIITPLHRALNQYRRQWRLRSYNTLSDSFSPFAQITQLVPEFDLPRTHLPRCFHYVGPYRRGHASQTTFAYERLDARPLLYACLGTLHGSRARLWHTIAESCLGLPVQLVISLGKRGSAPELAPLPGDPIVEHYLPQRELLARASLTITHAGLNSAMEALAAGVPMVAIPIVGDQFGVAARIVHSGTGESIDFRRCDSERLRTVVRRVLEGQSYRRRAADLRTAIERTTGAEQAADIIEKVAITGHAVLHD